MPLDLLVQCKTCWEYYNITVPQEAYRKWQKEDVLIQDVLPELTRSERELLISATCGTCFDNMWKKFEQ